MSLSRQRLESCSTKLLCSPQSSKLQLKMTLHTCWMLQLWLWHWVHRKWWQVKGQHLSSWTPVRIHTQKPRACGSTHAHVNKHAHTQLRVIWGGGQCRGSRRAPYVTPDVDGGGASLVSCLNPPQVFNSLRQAVLQVAWRRFIKIVLLCASENMSTCFNVADCSEFRLLRVAFQTSSVVLSLRFDSRQPHYL